MKNKQNGFVGIVLLIIIAIAVIGGGIYYTQSKKEKVEMPADQAVSTEATPAHANNNTLTQNSNLSYPSQPTVSANVSTNASVKIPAVANTVPCGFTVTSTTLGAKESVIASADIVKSREGTFYVKLAGTLNNDAKLGCRPWHMFEGKAGTVQAYIQEQGEASWHPAGMVHSISVDDWTKSATNFSGTVDFGSTLIGKTDFKSKIVFKDENASGLATGSNMYELFLTEFDKQNKSN